MKETRLAANAGMLVAAVLFGGSVVATRVGVHELPPLSLAVPPAQGGLRWGPFRLQGASR